VTGETQERGGIVAIVGFLWMDNLPDELVRPPDSNPGTCGLRIRPDTSHDSLGFPNVAVDLH
jgi:hypothetical protein